jgi:hypothetical protein
MATVQPALRRPFRSPPRLSWEISFDGSAAPEAMVVALHRCIIEPFAVDQPAREPVENSFIESFNGKLREDCLSANQFL